MWPLQLDPAGQEKGEAAESLLTSSDSLSELGEQIHRRHAYRSITMLVLTHCFLAAIGLLVGSRLSPDSTVIATRVSARYSPFIKDVGLRFDVVPFKGSFFNETIFRHDPSPEVDAAWKSLGIDYRALRVPEEEAARSGMSPDQVKINSKYGGGFPANVEGLHHLHCLNLLRQSLYYNFDYYHALGEGAFQNEDDILKYHITHCLDILRQQLMCTVDVGMLGQIWWDQESPKAFVDFNTKHTCRNFEDVRKWAEERQLPENPPHDFLQPPNANDYIYPAIP